MRAAEKLIADQGLENVSIRQIVSHAQQKNESALQYHFGNLSGLIKAIHAERSALIIAKRAELLDALLAKKLIQSCETSACCWCNRRLSLLEQMLISATT